MSTNLQMCVRYAPGEHSVSKPDDLAPLVAEFLGDKITECEVFCIIALSAKLDVLQIEAVHVGNLTQSMVCPQRTFRCALLANAVSIALAHNHPSGDVIASPEDIQVTKELVAVGKILHVPVVDHIIVAAGNRWESIKLNNLWLFQ